MRPRLGRDPWPPPAGVSSKHAPGVTLRADLLPGSTEPTVKTRKVRIWPYLRFYFPVVSLSLPGHLPGQPAQPGRPVVALPSIRAPALPRGRDNLEAWTAHADRRRPVDHHRASSGYHDNTDDRRRRSRAAWAGGIRPDHVPAVGDQRGLGHEHH